MKVVYGDLLDKCIFFNIVGLHYQFVYSFYLLSALLRVCGCLLFELGMMKVSYHTTVGIKKFTKRLL